MEHGLTINKSNVRWAYCHGSLDGKIEALLAHID